MIKANELRIGNWVMVVDESSPVMVTGIWDESIKYKESGDVAGRIKPIPITPEILEKAGFEYGSTEGIASFEDDSNDPEGVTHYWDIPIKRTDLVDGHNISLVKWGEQEYFTFQLERGFYRQKIKHLHQLQNLYFALTGEELEISL